MNKVLSILEVDKFLPTNLFFHKETIGKDWVTEIELFVIRKISGKACLFFISGKRESQVGTFENLDDAANHFLHQANGDYITLILPHQAFHLEALKAAIDICKDGEKRPDVIKHPSLYSRVSQTPFSTLTDNYIVNNEQGYSKKSALSIAATTSQLGWFLKKEKIESIPLSQIIDSSAGHIVFLLSVLQNCETFRNSSLLFGVDEKKGKSLPAEKFRGQIKDQLFQFYKQAQLDDNSFVLCFLDIQLLQLAIHNKYGSVVKEKARKRYFAIGTRLFSTRNRGFTISHSFKHRFQQLSQAERLFILSHTLDEFYQIEQNYFIPNDLELECKVYDLFISNFKPFLLKKPWLELTRIIAKKALAQDAHLISATCPTSFIFFLLLNNNLIAEAQFFLHSKHVDQDIIEPLLKDVQIDPVAWNSRALWNYLHLLETQQSESRSPTLQGKESAHRVTRFEKFIYLALIKFKLNPFYVRKKLKHHFSTRKS